MADIAVCLSLLWMSVHDSWSFAVQFGLRQDGTIHNVNSLDAFKAFDRQAAVHQVGVVTTCCRLCFCFCLNQYDQRAAGDKSQCHPTIFLLQVAQQIWQNIVSGEALRQPATLNRFLLLTYADLKHYKFFYWQVAHATSLLL